jgi:hypothetical protein
MKGIVLVGITQTSQKPYIGDLEILDGAVEISYTGKDPKDPSGKEYPFYMTGRPKIPEESNAFLEFGRKISPSQAHITIKGKMYSIKSHKILDEASLEEFLKDLDK